MKRLIVAAGLLAMGMSAVLAQSDPIAARKANMKRNGAALGELTRESKGDAPFDLAKIDAALTNLIDTAKVNPSLYPDNSKTGGDTHASPKIWEDKAAFNAAFAKFQADSEAALAAIKTVDDLKAQLPKVASNCGSCHQAFRTSMN